MTTERDEIGPVDLDPSAFRDPLFISEWEKHIRNDICAIELVRQLEARIDIIQQLSNRATSNYFKQHLIELLEYHQNLLVKVRNKVRIIPSNEFLLIEVEARKTLLENLANGLYKKIEYTVAKSQKGLDDLLSDLGSVINKLYGAQYFYSKSKGLSLPKDPAVFNPLDWYLRFIVFREQGVRVSCPNCSGTTYEKVPFCIECYAKMEV